METQLPQPLSPYAISKVACEYYGEIFTRDFGLDAISLRCFNVFGPRQDPNSAYTGVLSIFIAAYMSGISPTIFGDGEQSRDFTFVSNTVDAILLALQSSSAPGKVINVGTGQNRSLNHTIEVLNRILKMKVMPQYQPARAGDVRHSTADISLARRILGYDPKVDFEEGLTRTINWFRSR